MSIFSTMDIKLSFFKLLLPTDLNFFKYKFWKINYQILFCSLDCSSLGFELIKYIFVLCSFFANFSVKLAKICLVFIIFNYYFFTLTWVIDDVLFNFYTCTYFLLTIETDKGRANANVMSRCVEYTFMHYINHII